ncbi:protein kinase family protein [Agilicoccus flavus]|uniref:protein kinase family protein n=1 Tax=Agilicoccus flavus TaxID=2775968 RepID=UPI001CF6A249|nr:protein kinase family protein [Agilicoccus flavus]
MQGVGAGRLISNRYALAERRAWRGDVEVWRATDNTLGREVSVTVFPTSHPQAQVVLDAARRSAAINDHRLIRVLDVGTRGDVSWLVEESLSESTSLADLISRGPLPAEEARRIAGEVAGALDVAARRGLHHLHVTPHSVRRTDGGLVKIAGLATAAAFEGGAEPDAATAARLDTAATVALMYAVMTTRWPGREPVPGVAPAPRIVGGVAAPSEIATNVPPDLDALARVTLNHDGGPRTPAELTDRIAPWSSTRVDHVAPRAGATDRPVVTERTRQLAAAPSGAGRAAAAPLARVADKHREHRAARAAQTRARLEERRNDPGFLNLPEALERQRHDPLPAPAPLIAAEPAVEGRYAKLVIAIVAAIIVLAMAFAIPTIKGAFTAPARSGSPSPTATPGSRTAAPSSSATRSAARAAAAPVKIASATGFDPEGNGSENNGRAARVIDGKTDTRWTSEGYKQPFGDGGKKGIGVLLTLPAGSTVRKVDLDLGDVEQTVSVYAGDARRITADGLVGTAADASGKVAVTAKAPIQGARYVIVWVTKTAEQENRYRANLVEAAVS